jgi:hypothetical protein
MLSQIYLDISSAILALAETATGLKRVSGLGN